MTRIKQFADDLGISYKEAEKLIMASRKKKDEGQRAIDRRLREMERQHEEADKIAADDANMVLKAKSGASVKVEDMSPPKPDYEFGRTKGGGRMAPKVPGKLTRRGDDEKVEKKAGGGLVRGMGRAYAGNPREVKIR